MTFKEWWEKHIKDSTDYNTESHFRIAKSAWEAGGNNMMDGIEKMAKIIEESAMKKIKELKE